MVFGSKKKTICTFVTQFHNHNKEGKYEYVDPSLNLTIFSICQNIQIFICKL